MKADPSMAESTSGTVPVSHASNEIALKRRAHTVSIVLRLVGSVLSLIALVVMVTDKQTHNFIFPTTPPIVLTKKAAYSNVKALVFYVYVTGIVAAYLLAQVVFLTIAGISTSQNRLRLWLTLVFDHLSVYLLLSAAAAATEVAYLAKVGDPAVAWEPVCDNFKKFCGQVGGSLMVCFLAILTVAALAVVSGYQLFGGNRRASAADHNDAYKKTTNI